MVRASAVLKWTFRNYPTDENRALVVIQYAAEKRGLRSFPFFSVDTDYGRRRSNSRRNTFLVSREKS